MISNIKDLVQQSIFKEEQIARNITDLLKCAAFDHQTILLDKNVIKIENL